MIISFLIVVMSLLAFTPSSIHKSRTRSFTLITLTFMHRASSLQDRRFATLQTTLLIYLINK